MSNRRIFATAAIVIVTYSTGSAPQIAQRSLDGITQQAEQGMSQRRILRQDFGFDVRVIFDSVSNGVNPYRDLFVLIPANSLSASNLNDLFLRLASHYPEPDSLAITAFSDEDMLLRAINQYRNDYCVQFPDSPAGKEAREKWANENLPRATGYHRAYYRRGGGEEYILYSPDPDKEQHSLIRIKPSNIQYTGNKDSDIFKAVLEGDATKVEALLSAGVSPNVMDDEGNTLPVLAALTFRSDVLRILLGNGADVKAKGQNGFTALMHAASHGDMESLEALLGSDSELNTRNINGDTALMLAASNGQSDAVAVLLSRGAHTGVTNNKGWTALMGAAANGELESVKLLLEAGANVKLKDNQGLSAVELVRGPRRKELTTLLEESDYR